MILLTRLGGNQMAVNPDLIERAETTPDTIITMVDGHKLIVVESVDEVVDRVRTWRASVAAQAYDLSHEYDPHTSGAPMERSSADELSEHVMGASLARVLRMPTRGV